MKSFTLSKKGNPSIAFFAEEYVLSGIPGMNYSMEVSGVKINLRNKAECTAVYQQYLSKGYTVKVSAPKPEATVANDRFIWCKESRTHYAKKLDEERQKLIASIRNLKGSEYTKARKEGEAKIKASLKEWEAKTAAEWNKTLLQRRAEEAAISG